MKGKTRKFQVFAGLTALAVVAYAAVILPGKMSRAARLMEVRRTIPIAPAEVVKGEAPGTVDASPLPPSQEGLPAVEAIAPPGPPRALPADEPLSLPAASEPRPVAAPAAVDPQPAPDQQAFADPEKSAADFLARSRKEAADAVEALNREASSLRERLAKVEVGLARYKATLDALDAPGPHAGDKHPEGEPVFVPAKAPEGGPDLEPAKALPPAADPVSPPPGEEPRRKD